MGLSGQEDVSWSYALRALAGRERRGKADLIHLFHPTQERKTRRTGSTEGRALYRRYRMARRDPDRMRALIQEAHECSPTF